MMKTGGRRDPKAPARREGGEAESSKRGGTGKRGAKETAEAKRGTGRGEGRDSSPDKPEPTARRSATRGTPKSKLG